MRKITVIIALLFITTLSSFAQQKFAFVDTDYILKKIPSYEAAQQKLDEISVEWQKEIEGYYTQIDKLYKNYQSEKVLLTEEMKKKREEEIINKEKEVKVLQKKYFGKEGQLYKKRQELVKPIQDEVYDAVKEIATDGNYGVVFDIASGATVLFSNPKFDVSDEILKKLGYKN